MYDDFCPLSGLGDGVIPPPCDPRRTGELFRAWERAEAAAIEEVVAADRDRPEGAVPAMYKAMVEERRTAIAAAGADAPCTVPVVPPGCAVPDAKTLDDLKDDRRRLMAELVTKTYVGPQTEAEYRGCRGTLLLHMRLLQDRIDGRGDDRDEAIAEYATLLEVRGQYDLLDPEDVLTAASSLEDHMPSCGVVKQLTSFLEDIDECDHGAVIDAFFNINPQFNRYRTRMVVKR